jgi:hypothetical protein
MHSNETFPPAHDPLRILRFAFKRRRRGKISQLPEAAREQINLMIQDGVPYAEIIARLGEVGKGLNEDNLSRWRKTNYQDWLNDQLWERAVPQQPSSQSHRSAEKISRLLMEFDAEILLQIISRDPGKYPPLLKAIAKLSEAACESNSSKREGSSLRASSLSALSDKS